MTQSSSLLSPCRSFCVVVCFQESQSASQRLLSFRQTPSLIYVVLFAAVDAGSVGFAINKIHYIPLSKGVGCLDTALFSSSAVKVELGWCALMSSAQLSLESHLFRYAADILAVVRSCSMISSLDTILDGNSSTLDYKNLVPNGLLECK